MLCCSLSYRQRTEELTQELQGLRDEHESMTAKVSELQAALSNHQQVISYVLSTLVSMCFMHITVSTLTTISH